MQVFVGQTRSRKLIARLAETGFGEMTQPYEFPPRRSPWVLDNGAFGDWKAGRDFNSAAFLSACSSAAARPDPDRPAWCVCPDRVATGRESLAFSLNWLDEHGSAHPDLRWYLVTQDGMTDGDVRPVARRFAGLFVGGSLPWKLETGAAWASTAHSLGMPCHIGRVGTYRRVQWAQRIGADSIDSCLPLWAADKLDRFVAAVEQRQGQMPW